MGLTKFSQVATIARRRYEAHSSHAIGFAITRIGGEKGEEKKKERGESRRPGGVNTSRPSLSRAPFRGEKKKKKGRGGREEVSNVRALGRHFRASAPPD